MPEQREATMHANVANALKMAMVNFLPTCHPDMCFDIIRLCQCGSGNMDFPSAIATYKSRRMHMETHSGVINC